MSRKSENRFCEKAMLRQTSATGARPRLAMAARLTGCSFALALMTIDYARADDVPTLDIAPTCHGIAAQAATPAEQGGPDLAYSQCVQSEQATRSQLAGEWSTFDATDKANCMAEAKMAGLPSYTDLLTCLEMARDAKSNDQRYKIER